jgi:hypothetical protein
MTNCVLFSFLGAYAKLRKATVSFMSVRLSAWNNSAPTRRIFMKFYIYGFLENMLRKVMLHQNLTRITGNLHQDLRTFMVTSR